MKVTVWHSPEIKPHDNAKIRFKLKDDDFIYEGLYIEQEDMFFVGFENESDNFHFTWKVEKWSFMEETKVQKQESVVEWFYEKIKSHFEHDGDLLETLTFTYAIAKEKEKKQKEKEFIEGYKKRAELSCLIFDESSELFAKSLFEKKSNL